MLCITLGFSACIPQLVKLIILTTTAKHLDNPPRWPIILAHSTTSIVLGLWLLLWYITRLDTYQGQQLGVMKGTNDGDQSPSRLEDQCVGGHQAPIVDNTFDRIEHLGQDDDAARPQHHRQHQQIDLKGPSIAAPSNHPAAPSMTSAGSAIGTTRPEHHHQDQTAAYATPQAATAATSLASSPNTPTFHAHS